MRIYFPREHLCRSGYVSVGIFNTRCDFFPPSRYLSLGMLFEWSFFLVKIFLVGNFHGKASSPEMNPSPIFAVMFPMDNFPSECFHGEHFHNEQFSQEIFFLGRMFSKNSSYWVFSLNCIYISMGYFSE